MAERIKDIDYIPAKRKCIFPSCSTRFCGQCSLETRLYHTVLPKKKDEWLSLSKVTASNSTASTATVDSPLRNLNHRLTYFICSRHFQQDDYLHPKSKRLKRDADPSLFLDEATCSHYAAAGMSEAEP